MHIGFSCAGFLMLVMLFIPNLFWTRNKPKDYEKYVVNENKFLLCLERIGEAAVTILSLLSADSNFGTLRIWSLWLLAAAVMMVLYEIYWVRYFRSGQTMEDFYSSLFGIPVAGASLPVIAFFLFAVYGKNIFLGIAVVILGVGHIGIHLNHRKEVSYRERNGFP